MAAPESPQNFPSPEQLYKNAEESFRARMQKWFDLLRERERGKTPVSDIERTALLELRDEIRDILTKPFEREEKKSFLRDLLRKIENVLGASL